MYPVTMQLCGPVNHNHNVNGVVIFAHVSEYSDPACCPPRENTAMIRCAVDWGGFGRSIPSAGVIEYIFQKSGVEIWDLLAISRHSK